jgi:hypothetical protein
MLSAAIVHDRQNTNTQEKLMTTTYRYAWLAVLDGDGRRKLNEDLLDMDDVNPALTQQNTPGVIWVVTWDASATRLATTALSRNIGTDPDIEVVLVGIPGTEETMKEWIDSPQGRTLRSHALSVQPWVYSASA